MDLLTKSDKNYAIILPWDLIQIVTIKHGINSFYKPELSPDTSISMDIIAIAIRKGFKYKKDFNRKSVLIILLIILN